MPARSPFAASAVLLLCACGAPLPQELELEASTCEESPVLHAGAHDPFTLINAYYLQDETARALATGADLDVLEETLTKAELLGVRAVRTWAFNDDPAKTYSAIQRAPLQYDETALRALDHVLAAAVRHGLGLILPLGNFWNDYGGARQYVVWAGLPDPVEGDPRFFTDERIRSHYRAHLAFLLDRVNTVDGIRYGEHPAVLAWELLNEARLDPLTADELRVWASEMASTLRRHAPGHLISSGEEGRDGISAELLGVDGIDVGSMHLFPESFGWDPLETAWMGARFIEERARTLHDGGRALWLGEFGLRNSGAFTLDERRAMYRGWLTCARKVGLAAAGPWMFANDDRPADWDAHTFFLRDGTTPEDRANSYADLILEAGSRWATDMAKRRSVATR